jgi:diguanylate cyclase (GGDEF)-like protein
VRKGQIELNRKAKALISLAVSCLLFTIAYFASRWLKTEFPESKMLLQYSTYVIFAMGIFFGWWFNRSRVLFSSVTLMLSQIFLMHYTPKGMEASEYYNMVLSIISVYVPLNILVFSVLRERGIVSAWGRMRFLFITVELLIGAWIIWYNDIDLLQLFNVKLLPMEIKQLTGLPHMSIILFLAALIYLFVRQILVTKTNDAPFIGITIFSFAALTMGKESYAAAVMFALSGIMLLTVVIKASYSMAYLDELTELPSRRAFKEELQKLGSKYSIAMLDIDHFKKFNDTHGHEVGDDVLKLTAVCIKGIEGGGRAFRYGGEEFTIIFPGKSAEEAIPYLEELREYIANRGFIKRSKNRPKEKPAQIVTKGRTYKKLYLTVSIGIAEKSEKYRNAEEVTAAADKALYRAKSKGRNCVSK